MGKFGRLSKRGKGLQIPGFLTSSHIISVFGYFQILGRRKWRVNALAKVFAKIFLGRQKVAFCREKAGKKACQDFWAKTFLY